MKIVHWLENLQYTLAVIITFNIVYSLMLLYCVTFHENHQFAFPFITVVTLAIVAYLLMRKIDDWIIRLEEYGEQRKLHKAQQARYSHNPYTNNQRESRSA